MRVKGWISDPFVDDRPARCSASITTIGWTTAPRADIHVLAAAADGAGLLDRPLDAAAAGRREILDQLLRVGQDQFPGVVPRRRSPRAAGSESCAASTGPRSSRVQPGEVALAMRAYSDFAVAVEDHLAGTGRRRRSTRPPSPGR